MANLGKLYIDAALLGRLLNFPPEHGIVSMGYDEQNGGYLIVCGPTLPASDGQGIATIALETNFFGGGFSAGPTAPPKAPF
jgi:hypothetical protein